MSSKPSGKGNASQAEKVARNVAKCALPRNVIDRNNTIVLIEINTFRLMYKILQKLQSVCTDEKELINCLGNEILRRVDALNGFFSPGDADKENGQSGSVPDYGVA